MKILYDIYNVSGGASKSQIEHMLTMKENGHEVVATIGKDYEKLKEIVDGITILKTKNFNIRNPLSSIVNIFRWSTLVKKVNPDIIHTNRTVQNKFISIVSKLTGVPHIPTNPGGSAAIHNILPLKGSNLIVYSHENKMQFCNYGHDEKKVHVISNRISVKESPDGYREKKSSDKLSLLLIGNYKRTTINGVLKFLEFIKTNSSNLNGKVEIHFAGRDTTDDQEYLPLIISEIKEINYSPNVNIIYHGWVDDIAKLEDTCDICIGKGRSVLQPAMKGKVCFVISEEGFVTRIRKDTIEKLYQYNFTCRGTSIDDSNELIEIINDREIYKKFKNDSNDMIPCIKDWYLVDNLYDKLIDVYEVTIKSSMKSNNNIFSALYIYYMIYYGALIYGHKKA